MSTASVSIVTVAIACSSIEYRCKSPSHGLITASATCCQSHIVTGTQSTRCRDMSFKEPCGMTAMIVENFGGPRDEAEFRPAVVFHRSA